MLLYMILYPEMQRKVQNEIDEVVGHDREVRFEDKINLPYTDAVINEVRRIATPFPMTPPRIASKAQCLKINQNVAFQFWLFPPIFVQLELTCLVTLFFKNSPKSPKMSHLNILNLGILHQFCTMKVDLSGNTV